MPTVKGRPLSPEHRAAIAKANTGRKMSEEWRAKISAANKGKKRSPEARANISKGKRGKPGRKLYDWEKEALRKRMTGSSPSEEVRRKMSEAKRKNPTNYWLGKERGPQS